MADDADVAQAAEAFARERAIQNLRRALLPQEGIGLVDCQSCGFEIPEARRRILPGATRCTECQTIFDRNINQRR